MFLLGGTSVMASISLMSCIFSLKFFTTHGLWEQTQTIPENSSRTSFSYLFYERFDYPRDCMDVLGRCSHSVQKGSGAYLIKPDGYTEPFEVYCNNEIDAGGWTTILRRRDGSLSVRRTWDDYKSGFGFLSSEHWIGNEKLSYLTNQAEYELRIDFVSSNGSFYYITYSFFRISDEWGQYALVSIGEHSGNASLMVFECPPNMVYRNVTCQPTCDDPKGSLVCSAFESGVDQTCVCQDGFLKKGVYCVHPSECGCFVTEDNLVIPNNGTYVNSDCSKKCNCQNGQLTCGSSYQCSPNGVCDIRDNVRKCYCNERYQGDGETCNPLFRDCYDAFEAGERQNGVYTILPHGWIESPFDVYCDMTTAGGGWTVFQRRVDRVTNFRRNWLSYRDGFGTLPNGNDFWLGNKKLHHLTNNNQRRYKVRIDIVTSDGSPKYDEYASFRLDDEDATYRLVDLGSHSGTAGNGMVYTSGREFSTYDIDNDECGIFNCADKHRGGWWYGTSNYGSCGNCWGSHCYHFQHSSSCHTYCTFSNINGDYNGGNGESLFWGYSTHYCNLVSAEMKLRPIM